MKFKIVKFNLLESTQIQAKKIINTSNNINNFVIVAQKQTDAYGRFKRKWFSPVGGLWFSIILKPKISLEKIHQLTALTSLSVIDSIKNVCDIDLYIKWPNDIVYKKNSSSSLILIHKMEKGKNEVAKNGFKKVCGILIETLKHKSSFYAIIGIGINVHNIIQPKLKNTAISLKEITDKKIELIELLENFLKVFSKNYEQFLNKGFSHFLKSYKKKSIVLNKKVILISENKKYIGKVINIEQDTGLLVNIKNKKIKFHGGDLHLLN